MVMEAKTGGLASLTVPAVMLPAPLQPRIPRGPVRIIVLCDGTAQARNWVKTKLNAARDAPSDDVEDWDRCDNSAPPRRRSSKDEDEDDSTEQPTGDFFTNVALLAKILSQSSGNPPTGAGDSHTPHPIPQLVFYQSGVGTGTGKLQNLFDQGTGLSLGSKIEEAYGFIVDNYQPGDELFLFGFSRGAYTARCINGFLNWCGILSKVEMTHFADIWAAYQRRDPDKISTESYAAQVLYKATLRYPSAESEQVATGIYAWNLVHMDKNKHLDQAQRSALLEKRKKECEKRRQKTLVVPPQIKAIGVWDTVSALGFPGMFQDNAMIDFFDFYDPGLGSNVQFGFHALSLEEDRKDFLPTLWYQPPPPSSWSTSAPSSPVVSSGGEGEFGVRGQFMRSKQVLKQCWFQGVHTDCGGGYQYHGLSDLTLIWMVSQLVDQHTLPDGTQTLGPLLNIDLALLATILDRRREWGKQRPHRSRPTVNYAHARTVNQRDYDAVTMKRSVWATMRSTGRTFESIHPSVVRGARINPDTHPAFAELRRRDPEKLASLWKQARDWSSLRPTERLLYWSARAPYPWIPTLDAALNPLVSPLVVTGGWNIPELASARVRRLVIQAAQRAQAEADVDAIDTTPHASSSAAADGDVDDQPADGWATLADTNPNDAAVQNDAVKDDADRDGVVVDQEGGMALALPVVTYPEIAARELGENPIDPSRPRLRRVWQKTYDLVALPNALFVDAINLARVPTDNLRQTALQSWWWNLGDRLAGFPDELKTQELQASVPKPSQKTPHTRNR